jgi:mannose-1-phosphate guanylyltransferase
MQVPDNAYAVILAGGSGTRLWPKSRKKLPKHLAKILGDKTFIRVTFERIVSFIPVDRILVITREDQAELVKKELPELPSANVIAEPMARSTALAMGVAAAIVHKKDPAGVLTYLAADHIIQNVPKYHRTVNAALKVAMDHEYIVAVGIRPTFPHTGFGYIKVGEELFSIGEGKEQNFVFKGDGFKEKPDLATATAFIASNEYLWNANLYCWSTTTIFNAFAKYAPEIGESVKHIMAAIGTPDESKVMKDVYEKSSDPAIDTAVSEKADNVVVIPGDFGWNDVGDWKVVYDINDKDDHLNVVNAKQSILIDSTNCLVEGNGRMVVTIGLDNIVVIDTEDAVLICHKDRTQDVKKVVEKLKEEKKEEYL